MTLKQKAITLISFISIAIVCVAFVYWKGVSYFLNQSQSIADGRVLVDTETKRAHDVSVLKQQVVVARSQQEKLNQFFLGKDQIAPFLGYLENIGTENSSVVSIGSVEILKGLTQNNLSITFKISGTYQQVLSTLGQIEQIPYYSKIQKVILNVAPGSGGGEVATIVGADGKTKQVKTPKTDPLWSADVNMLVFSFVESNADGAIENNFPVTENKNINNTTVPRSIN
ncbi:MAG: hypothetical protein ACR2IQ_01410 [Minisyncoccia bacterium]